MWPGNESLDFDGVCWVTAIIVDLEGEALMREAMLSRP